MTKWLGWNIGDVNSRSDKDWIWFASSDYLMCSLGMNKDSNINIIGKYLFFHKESNVLEQIAMKEIKSGKFHLAKVAKKPVGGNLVLCLYDNDESKAKELSTKYQNKNGIKYRFWKLDEDTRQGKYSKEFLDKLDL